MLSLIFGALLTETGDPDGVGQAEVIRQLNVLERSLAGMTGISCLALAAILVVQVRQLESESTTFSVTDDVYKLQTGAIPLTSSISSPTSPTPDAPFRTPTVLVATAFFTALSWFSYEDRKSVV